MRATVTQSVTRAVVFWAVGLVFKLLWLALRLVLKLVYRFAVGLPLDGNLHTDATFWSAGTTDIRERKWFALRKPSRWAFLPGYKRMLIRWIGVALAAAAFWWPTQVAVVVVVLLGVVLGLAVWRVLYGVMSRRHNERYVYPLHVALAGVLGVDESTPPAKWLEVPRDFAEDHAVITVDLPPKYTRARDQDKAVVSVVTSKLGLADSEMEPQFHMVGGAPYVEFHHAPRPPDLVTVDDVRELLELAPESAPLIGLGRRGKPIANDMDQESPHTLISMGTNGGKSNLAYGLAAQALHHGGLVVILDIKRHSLRGLRGLPGVTYVRDLVDIHNALLWLAAEGDRRNRIADDDEHAEFTRILVIFEEMNATIGKLNRYWKKIKEKDDLSLSPAVEAWSDLSFMGRAVKLNTVAIGQLMTARATGGNEARENFGNRILGRYTVNNWRMLVPEVWPMPRSSKRRGRVQVVVAGEAEETQVTLWTVEEAREWATSGVSQRPSLALTLPSAGEGVVTVSELAESAGSGPAAEAVTDGPAEPVMPELVSLREACEWGVVQVSGDLAKALKILRAARQRDPEFPNAAEKRGLDHLYDPAELQRWERNRPRAGGLEIESGAE